MKYLKKIFENNKVIDTNILGDILLEISDLGYLSHINNSWWSDDRPSSITLTLYGKNQTYIFPDEIMDAVERIVEFLDGEGYVLFDDGEKILEIIKNRPTEQVYKMFVAQLVLEAPIGRHNKVNMKWNKETNQYIITSNISLQFRN